MRKRIAGTGTALVLAITFAVMAATGIALARGDRSTATTPAETQTVIAPCNSESSRGGGFGNSVTCRIPMLVRIPE